MRRLAIPNQPAHIANPDRGVSEQLGCGVHASAPEIVAKAAIAELLVGAL
ncbi:MAG TPA: hypothetical protein VK680_14040 [Solirubrobacteraceae bacterium]|nr:hypothetical protein [Solirubrobacteraceae bacterium]